MAEIKEQDEAWRKFQLKHNLATEDSLKAQPENITATLPMPNTHAQGGPFAGSNLTHQRLVSNDTYYLTFRDDEGAEISADDSSTDEVKVEFDFKINITDFVLKTFTDKASTGLRCAYLPVGTTDAASFGTDKCKTSLLDETNKVIFATEGWSPPAERVNMEKVLKGQQQLQVKCVCSHMSYYTLIQQLAEPDPAEPPLKFDKDVR